MANTDVQVSKFGSQGIDSLTSDDELVDVQEDGDKGSFEEETKVAEVVDHTLLRDGEVSGLADHEISPLDANDGDEIA